MQYFLSILWDVVNLREPIHHPLPCICCEEQCFLLVCWISQKIFTFFFPLENIASYLASSQETFWDSIWKVLSLGWMGNRQTS